MSNSFVTPWTIVQQAPLSIGFPRQEYWNGLPFPSPEDLLNPGIKPTSPALAGGFYATEPPGKPLVLYKLYLWFNSIITPFFYLWISCLGWRGRYLIPMLARARTHTHTNSPWILSNFFDCLYTIDLIVYNNGEMNFSFFYIIGSQDHTG